VMGVVKDSATGQPITGATIIILETGDTTQSNGSGFYHISNVPKGSYTFLIGYPNYQPQIQPSVRVGSCCLGIRGNVDGIIGAGGSVDVADLTYLVAFLFQGGTAPPCEEEGNVDGIVGIGGPIDIADLTYLVAYLFQGGPSPPSCP